jgi:hypothetical protein
MLVREQNERVTRRRYAIISAVSLVSVAVCMMN